MAKPIQPHDTDLIERVKQLLTISQCSQKKLADNLGYSPATINLWLKEKYTGDVCKLEVAISTWLGDDGAETPPTIPDDAIWEISIGERFFLVRDSGRPWVPIEPLCTRLMIDPTIQVRRLLRHQKQAGLNVRFCAHRSWLLLPLEELQWFLRTLKPRQNEALERLERYKAILFWNLAYAWVVNGNQWNAFRERNLAHPIKVPSVQPVNKPRFTPDDADEMRRMRRTGMSYAEIGAKFGCDKALTWRIVNGTHATWSCVPLK